MAKKWVQDGQDERRVGDWTAPRAWLKGLVPRSRISRVGTHVAFGGGGGGGITFA